MGNLTTQKKSSILRLISGQEQLSIEGLDGKTIIIDAEDIFSLNSELRLDLKREGLNKIGIAAPETLMEVYEIKKDSNFEGMFRSLPGKWEKKWLSQNQIIRFCQKYPHWLGGEGYNFFPCKKDENKPIDSSRPQDNLVIICVFKNLDSLGATMHSFNHYRFWEGKHHRRIIFPA